VATHEDAGALAHELTGMGFAVAVVTDFADAKNRVTTEPPDLLVTDVRLGPFNGLHLVFAGKSVKPALAAIVVGDPEDLALSSEAEQAGATFLLGPPSAGDLSGAIRRVMLHPNGSDRPAEEAGSLPSVAGDGLAATSGRPREERRHAPERRQAVAHAHDLHGRLEDKRQKIERERREFGRRLMDGSNDGH
jgi:DNA-binding NtrC family response regulator